MCRSIKLILSMLIDIGAKFYAVLSIHDSLSDLEFKVTDFDEILW